MKSVKIEAERLRIRKEPSTTADWTGEFAEPGRIYTVLEETENIELLSFLNDFIEESLKSTTETLERIREKINR